MHACTAGVTCDSEFRVPPDCLREGKIECRVIRGECRVVDRFGGKLRLRLDFTLRLTVRSGELRCSFEREVHCHETVGISPDFWVKDCEVDVARCLCTLRNGLVRCSIGAFVQLDLRRRGKHCHCHRCDCDPCACHRHDWDHHHCCEPRHWRPCSPCEIFFREIFNLW